MRIFVSVDIGQGVVLIRQLVAVSTSMVVVNRDVSLFCSLALELHQVRASDADHMLCGVAVAQT